MMFRNPWEIDWNDPQAVQQAQQPAQAPRSQRPIIQGPPREPAPMYPEQRELNQMQVGTEGLRQQQLRQQIEQQRREASGQQPLTPVRLDELRGAYNGLNMLERGIDELGTLYQRSFTGRNPAEYLHGGLRPENQQLNDASGRLAAFIANALELSGQQFNTPREQQLFIQSFLPSASDRDEVIQSKIDALTDLLNNARSSMAPRIGEEFRPYVNPLRRPTGTPGGEPEGEILDIGPIGVGINPPAPPAPPPPAQPGLGGQLLDAFTNTAAGIGQGIASIPDAGARALGATLAIPADWLGFENVADTWRNAGTIGGLIENAAPTPGDTAGQAARFVSQFAGGAASLPRRAATHIAERFGGRVPELPTVITPRANPRDVMRDADSLNIPMMPADVGGPMTRLVTSGVAQTPLGAGPLVRGGERTVAAGQRALGTIAGRAGSPAIPEAAGEAATRGALRYRSTSRTEASRMYDRAAQLSEGVRVMPERAAAVLQRHIDELGENPAGNEALSFLTGLRERLADPNGVTVAGIRGMRTQLRDRFFSAGLRGSDTERRVMEVVDAASDDVANSLANAGRGEAAELYRTADAAWRARAQALDEVIMPIIGRSGERSPEQVFRALQVAARSNGGRLNQFIRTLPEEEAATVRGSLINALGRSSAGRQGAEGDSFSLNQFLTHWNELSQAGRNAIFPRETRDAINALARVAENTKQASAYANTSRTGGVVATLMTGGSIAGGPGAIATVLGGQLAAGALLASPKVARILANIGSARTPGQARAQIGQLSRVAASNPAIANDIAMLQKRLADAFLASPATRAAAEQDQNIR